MQDHKKIEPERSNPGSKAADRTEPGERRHRKAAGQSAGEMAIIAEIGRIIGSTMNIEEVYERFAEEVQKIIPFDRIVICIIDTGRSTATTVYMAGHRVADRQVGVPYPIQGSSMDEMLRTRSSLLLQTENIEACQDRFPMLISTFQAGFRSLMNIPLLSKGEILGGLLLRSFKSHAYTDRDVRLAERVGHQIAGAIANARLFSDLKKAERSLRESERRYREFFDKSRDCVFIFSREGKWIDFNDAALEMFGYDSREALSQIPIASLYVNPEEHTPLVSLIEKQGSVKDHPLLLRRRDGSVIDALITVGSGRDADSSRGEVYGTIRDITVQRVTERKLRDAHAIQSLIMKNSTLGIALVRNRNFVWANNRLAELLGLPLDKIQGASTRVIYPSDEAYETLGRLAYPILTRGDSSDTTIQLSRSDGSLFWCRFIGRALDAADPHAGSIWMFEDITDRKWVEEKLRKNEARFRDLFQEAPVGYFEYDTMGLITRVNRTELDMLGYELEEMINQPVWKFLAGEETTRQQILSKLSGISETPRSAEQTYRRKDGTTFPALIQDRLMKDDRGNITGIRSAVQDITDRKQAEERLKESEKKYRELYDFLPIPVYEMDLEGNVTSANRAIYETFRGTEEDLKAGFNAWRMLSPEDVEKGIRNIQHQLQGGKIEGTEYRAVKRLDGSVFPAVVFSCIIYENEKPVGVRGAIIDITERKEAEQKLRDAHAKMAFLINSISSILITVSEDYRIMSWNTEAEKQFGIPERNVLGKPIDALGIQWELDLMMEGIAQCRRGKSTIGLDNIRFRQLNGKEGLLGMTISPSFGEESFGMATLIQGANVTERKILESQLSQAQKLESIGQLAAGIAHEINTPTQYVGDNVRFLQTSCEAIKKVLMRYDALAERIRTGKACDDLLGELEETVQETDLDYLAEEIPRAFQQTLEGVERVSRIVQSIRAFAHPGTEEKVPVDINRAIENTILVARNEWKYVADLVTDLDPSLPHVSCIPGDINQVLLNILINAAQAVSEKVNGGAGGKGKISISTRQDGTRVEIRIGDTGNGIPAEIRSRIFDPFFTTKEVGKGTGQGLAISHAAVVERNNGTISFDTEIGRGTTFIIRLPIQEKPVNAGN